MGSVIVPVILGLVVGAVGLSLIFLSSRIGLWLFDFYSEIRYAGKLSVFLTFGLVLWPDPVYFIWLLRICGIVSVGGSLLLFYVGLFS
jgi:multisubunit Na+/H+ antiporter MnhG subunit